MEARTKQNRAKMRCEARIEGNRLEDDKEQVVKEETEGERIGWD